MFDQILKAAKTFAETADAVTAVITKPITDGLEVINDGLHEITRDDEEQDR